MRRAEALGNRKWAVGRASVGNLLALLVPCAIGLCERMVTPEDIAGAERKARLLAFEEGLGN